MSQNIDSLHRFPWKLLARWILVIYAVVLISLATAGTWLFPDYARAHAAEFKPIDSWTVEQVQIGLEQLGWPATVPAYFDLTRNLYLMVVGGSVGFLLLWRKWNDWYGLFLAFVFISFCVGNATMAPLIGRVPGVDTLSDFLGTASWQFFFIIFYFFPNGRAEPRWARWLGFGWLVFIFIQPFTPSLWSSNFSALVFFFPLSAIASQIYRYLKRSDSVQRQQTKWFVTAVSLILLSILLTILTSSQLLWSNMGRSFVAASAAVLVFNIAIGLVPLAIAAAIFRYRLWDIDLIIRRTLQYTVLSAVLGLVYFGSVVLLRQFLSGLMGDSSIVIVLSTLLIALLFSPLRRVLQEGIDRRFFRRKYDSAQAIASFSDGSRNNLSLEELEHLLVKTINQTLEPERAALWLRQKQVHSSSNDLRNASRTLRK